MTDARLLYLVIAVILLLAVVAYADQRTPDDRVKAGTTSTPVIYVGPR